MRHPRRLRALSAALTLATVAAASLTPTAAGADEPQPGVVPAPPPVVQAQPAPTWRRYAFPSALVASGLGLATAVAFHVRAEQHTADFNAFMGANGVRCANGAAGRGGPTCDALHDDINAAQRWRNIGFGAAGAFAVTALVLKLTEPDQSSATVTASNRLACAPGLGLSATCALAF